MTLTQSIILGIVQGLTEFLPISSSGHLVLVPYLLNWNLPVQDSFIFDVLVQVATLIAVFAYFWPDLKQIITAMVAHTFSFKPLANPHSRLGYFILLGTIPAGILGLLLKDWVEKAFSNPIVTACFLFVTAAILFLAEKIGQRNRRSENIGWADALWIGIFQALAIFPGVSRSGATIVGGMTRNLERYSAAKFSFLLSIPIMVAAGLLAIYDLIKLPEFSARLPVFIPGFIVSAITGYLSIRWLLRFLIHNPLLWFSIYCTFLALTTILVHYLR